MVHSIATTDCQALVPVGNLAAYINWAQSIPVLSREEEDALVHDFFHKGDVSAAKKLVLSHLRFVVFVSRGFLGYGLPHEDLIQEGNVGLMKALQRFDPNAGVRLVSFAVYWIKSEIQEFVLKNWRIVKIATTKAARTLFFKKQHMKKHMTPDEVAYVSRELNVSEKDVIDMQMKCSTAHDVPYDTHDSDHEATKAPAVYLASQDNNPESSYLKHVTAQNDNARLAHALDQLDERSADIIRRRWLSEDNKVTLHDLASEYKISAQRVNQLEKTAFLKLRDMMSDA